MSALAELTSSVRRKLRTHRQLSRWRRAGCPVPPPPPIKQQIVLRHAGEYDCEVLVETGTFQGDMVAAMAPAFTRIYSIELQAELYQAAVQRFAGRPHVELLWGDSGQQLAELLPKIDRPCLFWLDGHWSGGVTARGECDTPIVAELEAIKQHPLVNRHVVLIDDARLFDGTHDYPTLEQLSELVDGTTHFEMSVEHDIICLTPHRQG